jgi:transitional endoplasmic reticulum ATPase
LEEAKEELRQAVEWPLKNPESFKKMGIKPPAGIMLFGPPGCGKTLLAKAVASESEANFISVKGPELLSMWVGESEKGIRKVFRKARQVAPCIVFFDEIDSIASRRGTGSDSHVTERVVNQLLTELDGIEQNRNVIFMAATNRPDLMDPGLLRPGRIDKLVKIEAPDKKGRMAIFKVHTKNVALAKDVSLEELVDQTEGFTGADIEGLIRSAALIALKERKMKPGPVEKKHLEQALKKARPTITPKLEEAYDRFEEHHAEFKPSYVG